MNGVVIFPGTPHFEAGLARHAVTERANFFAGDVHVPGGDFTGLGQVEGGLAVRRVEAVRLVEVPERSATIPVSFVPINAGSNNSRPNFGKAERWPLDDVNPAAQHIGLPEKKQLHAASERHGGQRQIEAL